MNAQHAELYRRIVAFQIDEPGSRWRFTDRLARENGWSHSFAQRVVQEYRRFAFLAVAAGHPVTPSEQVDQAWHLHLTYTRSYWDGFCGEVLGQSLHHNPTTGGSEERAKFFGWYNRTLNSYQRFFDQEPPRDIWPDAEQRFGDDLHVRRVNVKQNWIVSKRFVNQLGTGVVLLILGLIAGGGCVAIDGGREIVAAGPVQGVAWPTFFNLPGPQFLALFAAGFVVATLVAVLVRARMKGPQEAPDPDALDLDPYELAYLADGRQGTINAAVASLVSQDLLAVMGDERRLSLQSLSDVPLHPVEQTLLEAVDASSGTRIDDLHQDWPAVRELAERLQTHGLIMSDDQEWLGRVLPVSIVLAVPLMGAVKIFIGLSRDKPVGFLIAGCIVAVIVAFACFGRKLHRSHQGDRVLEAARNKHAVWQRNSEGRGELAGTDLALAMGLFGMSVLDDGPYQELHKDLKGYMKSTGAMGGCGGGDGGGGGGCGGCGGCG